ncbi:hypothetical protein EVAR_94208_1 [Eumeta japonica]|uniref:Uncharacterized protein n=1 Tax=Eumeta variegata TaxID=151549 RepID=A0A4C1UPN7_EUMVA|nr:hypothetical protein EVAR_94208_1 [Eumeta japonica]
MPGHTRAYNSPTTITAAKGSSHVCIAGRRRRRRRRWSDGDTGSGDAVTERSVRARDQRPAAAGGAASAHPCRGAAPHVSELFY